MSTAVLDIIRQAERLSLAEQLELIEYLAQRSRMQAEKRPMRKWSELAGVLDQPLYGEDAQTHISKMRDESDQARLIG